MTTDLDQPSRGLPPLSYRELPPPTASPLQTEAEEAFVAALNRLREQQKLSHNRFAMTVGISATVWQRIRDGERKVSLSLVAGALAAWPLELTGPVLHFLTSFARESEQMALQRELLCGHVPKHH